MNFHSKIKILLITMVRYYPLLYRASLRLRGMVRTGPRYGDDLFITGLPRSANTFFAFYLRCSFPDKYISSHNHVIAEIRTAIRLKIPVVVIIRTPMEAISSLAIKQDADVDNLVYYYNDYLKNLYKIMKHSGTNIKLIDFEDVTKDPDKIAIEVAAHCDWILPESEQSELIKKIVTDRINTLTRQRPIEQRNLPSNAKNELKKMIKIQIQNNSTFIDADSMYKQLREYV